MFGRHSLSPIFLMSQKSLKSTACIIIITVYFLNICFLLSVNVFMWTDKNENAIRRGTMHDFSESLCDGKSTGFSQWLTNSIAGYERRKEMKT